MQQTTTPSNISAESLAEPLSQNSTPTASAVIDQLAFLEGPAIALVDIEINEMTDSQLEAMLAELNTLCNQPGALRRRLGEEATEIKTKKPRAVKRKMDML